MCKLILCLKYLNRSATFASAAPYGLVRDLNRKAKAEAFSEMDSEQMMAHMDEIRVFLIKEKAHCKFFAKIGVLFESGSWQKIADMEDEALRVAKEVHREPSEMSNMSVNRMYNALVRDPFILNRIMDQPVAHLIR